MGESGKIANNIKIIPLRLTVTSPPLLSPLSTIYHMMLVPVYQKLECNTHPIKSVQASCPVMASEVNCKGMCKQIANSSSYSRQSFGGGSRMTFATPLNGELTRSLLRNNSTSVLWI